MKKQPMPPWSTGPCETLRHGLALLDDDSDKNRRLAMISIDNAVELMLKTYLGLPSRITGLRIPRKEYREFSESFPKLLDAVEKHASDKIDGIDLGEIEWYHRLRNELYHQGNGLTVERGKVEVYAELANVLFENLFGFRLVEPEEDDTRLLGDFMSTWIQFEKALRRASGEAERFRPALDALRVARSRGLLSVKEVADIDLLRRTRNEVVHGMADRQSLKAEMITRLKELTDKLGSIDMPQASEGNGGLTRQ